MTSYAKLKKTKFQNVFATPTGGHYVRARVTDPTTDKLVTIKKTLQTKDPLEAFQWLQAEVDRVRSGTLLPQKVKPRFSEFAAQLLEDKLATREIKSSAGRTRWTCTLEHLISGTTGESELYVPAFGDMYIDKIHVSHVEAWKLGIAGLIKASDYSPTTANGWLAILRVIMRAAKRKYGLSHLATEDVTDFRYLGLGDLLRGRTQFAHHRTGAAVPGAPARALPAVLCDGVFGVRNRASAVESSSASTAWT